MGNAKFKYVTIAYDFITEAPSGKAILVDTGDQEIWIPKSLTKRPAMDFEAENEMEVKYWFCKNEGLI